MLYVIINNITLRSTRTNELNSHGRHSQLQLHRPSHYRLTLDLVILYTPLKNTSKHTCLDSLSLKPPVLLYPLQDFKALCKYCIIIIIIIIITGDFVHYYLHELYTRNIYKRIPLKYKIKYKNK